jgi:hypothetical protein
MVEKEELIAQYDKLDLSDKRKELGREIAELHMITQSLITDIVPEYKEKTVDEFTNLFDDRTDEGEYLTGLYHDVIELEETFGSYCDIVTDLYYKDVDNSSDAGFNDSQTLNVAGFTKLGILIILTLLFTAAIVVAGVFLVG